MVFIVKTWELVKVKRCFFYNSLRYFKILFVDGVMNLGGDAKLKQYLNVKRWISFDI